MYQREFAGKLAVYLEGLWENKHTWKGGPLRSYAAEVPNRCGSLVSGLLPPIQPSLQGGWTFRRLFAQQQTFNTNILIEIRPVDTVTCAVYLRIGKFCRGSMRQTRIPANGNRNATIL